MMTKSQCVLRPLALGLLLAPFAPPQADRGPRAEPRRAIAGLVSDANGDPVAGATVTLAGALASPAWRADPDLLRTTTDELGRWRVRARECIEYTAWAAGGGLVSEVASGIVPGPRAELVLRHPPLRSIRIDGLEGWREREPLRARLWLDGGSGHHVEMPIRDGTIELPGEWPYSPFLLELVGADGSSIHVARQAAGTAAAAVAKPREVEILVEGPDGRPSAGAEIYCEQVIPTNLADIGRAWQRFEFVVGRTGVDGRCRARIGTAWQEAEPDHALFLRARKTGFSDTCGGFGWEGRSFAEGLTDEGGPDAPETEAGTLRLRLRPATSVRGHLTDGAVPVVGCPVAVTARRRIATRGGAGYFVATSIVTTTAADGSFVLPGVTRDGFRRVQFGAHDAVWGDDVPAAPAPGQPLFAVVDDDGGLQFDLARTARVAVQALRPDGGPASNAVLIVLPLRGDPAFLAADDPRYRLDPAGRASLLLERDTQWLLLVVDGSRVYAGEIDPNQTPERLELATREPPRLRVRVLDERGRPVAGAGLKASSFGCEGGTSPFETQLALLTSRLYIRSLERATTDAEGWLELPMFAEHLVQFEVYARKGEARSEDWPLRYGEQPFEVRLNSK